MTVRPGNRASSPRSQPPSDSGALRPQRGLRRPFPREELRVWGEQVSSRFQHFPESSRLKYGSHRAAFSARERQAFLDSPLAPRNLPPALPCGVFPRPHGLQRRHCPHKVSAARCSLRIFVSNCFKSAAERELNSLCSIENGSPETAESLAVIWVDLFGGVHSVFAQKPWCMCHQQGGRSPSTGLSGPSGWASPFMQDRVPGAGAPHFSPGHQLRESSAPTSGLGLLFPVPPADWAKTSKGTGGHNCTTIWLVLVSVANMRASCQTSVLQGKSELLILGNNSTFSENPPGLFSLAPESCK